MSGDIDISCLGEPMVEFTRLKKSVEENYYIQSLGGDTSNCAVAAARQGAKVAYITAVGDDRFGRFAIDFWRKENIDVSGVSVFADYPTGIYFIEPAGNARDFTYYRKGSAASAMTAENFPVEIISKSKFLHLSAISQAISNTALETCAYAINLAKQNAVKISYDTNLRLNLLDLKSARKLIHETAKTADILLPSLDEARLLSGKQSIRDIVEYYIKFGPDILALKCGDQGAVIAYENKIEFLPPLKVNAIDTSGAGDTFDGAFLSRLASGYSPFDAGEYAVTAAGLSVKGYGAVKAIPAKKTVLKKNASK